jgi:hypothetical protein
VAFRLLLPVTDAKNCCMLGVPVEGATKVYVGETATLTVPDGFAIVTVATPLREGSALLVAVSATGLLAGTELGAKKSTAAELGPAGAMHGFVPETQTWPTVAFPSGTPTTDHDTVVSAVFVTFAVNDVRCPVESVAVGGITLTVTALVIVTVAEAISGPLFGWGLTVA